MICVFPSSEENTSCFKPTSPLCELATRIYASTALATKPAPSTTWSDCVRSVKKSAAHFMAISSVTYWSRNLGHREATARVQAVSINKVPTDIPCSRCLCDTPVRPTGTFTPVPFRDQGPDDISRFSGSCDCSALGHLPSSGRLLEVAHCELQVGWPIRALPVFVPVALSKATKPADTSIASQR